MDFPCSMDGLIAQAMARGGEQRWGGEKDVCWWVADLLQRDDVGLHRQPSEQHDAEQLFD